MTAFIFFFVLILLTCGVWVVSAISFWYGHELLKRQKILTKALLPYLKKLEKDKATMTALCIDKDEPLSKYKNLTLPEEVHITFNGEKNNT